MIDDSLIPMQFVWFSYEIENVVVVVEKPKKKVKFDPNVTTYDYEAVDSVFESLDAQGSLSSSFVFPVNHRYQDWTFNDDDNVQEYLDDDFDDDDDEDDCSTDLHEEVEEEDESFDSYFSLQMDKVQQDLEEIGTVNPDDIMMKPKGKEGAARDRSYAHSVLIPVENLSQWKEAKGKKIMHPKNSAKENIESALPILVPIYDD